MPTGYTAIIGERKDVTFAEFAWLCARDFGALLSMRDDPLSKPIPEDVGFNSSYHDEALLKAEREWDRIAAMSDAECEESARAEYVKSLSARQDALAEKAELQSRYQTMLHNVHSWEPPTADHQGLKDFMIQQLTDSIKWDCGTYFHEAEPVKKSGGEWRTAHLQRLNRDIAYHERHGQEERDRDKERNEWVRQLRESLT